MRLTLLSFASLAVLACGDSTDGPSTSSPDAGSDAVAVIPDGAPPPDAAAPDASPPSAPAVPPAKICGNTAVLDGPATAPQGAVVVPAGDNANAFNGAAGTTYWFAPGKHTLGTGQFSQITPKNGDHFVGAPGAILDGQNKNRYAFTQHAENVVIEHLTIQNFGTGKSNNNEGVVNHDAGHAWTMRFNTIVNNDGAGVFLGTGNVLEAN